MPGDIALIQELMGDIQSTLLAELYVLAYGRILPNRSIFRLLPVNRRKAYDMTISDWQGEIPPQRQTTWASPELRWDLLAHPSSGYCILCIG